MWRLRQARSNVSEAMPSTEARRFNHGFRQMPASSGVLHGNASGPHAGIPAHSVVLGNQGLQRFFDGKPKKEPEKKPEPKKSPNREGCDNKCGTSGPFGNTECELDLKSGLPAGKVTKEVFDKNPCTRPCVEVHEGVHAKKIAPVCAAAKKCLDAAGGDAKKQEKCLDKYEADMAALTFSTECAAYSAEAECLGNRGKQAECKSADGKKRWDEQTKMVKCYKDCFCPG
jgi:hypothetical protein